MPHGGLGGIIGAGGLAVLSWRNKARPCHGAIKLGRPAMGATSGLDAAAKARLDTAEQPRSSQSWRRARESCSRRVTAGSIWSAWAAAFARRDMGGDHPPWDRLAAPQLPGPRRGPDDDAKPAAADIPAVDTDIDPVKLVAAQLHMSS